MTDVRCPTCDQPNPAGTETCKFCGAQLKPPTPASPAAPPSIRAGDEPVKKNTSEFEKVVLSPSDKEPIHPGEAPTKKNTAELERVLPTWLRTLRAQPDTAAPEAPVEPPAAESQEGQPPAPEQAPASAPSEEAIPDWLAGLGTAAAEEEIPDWLASLRGKGEAEDKPAPAAAPAPQAGVTDRPTQASILKTPIPPQPESAPTEGLPDWLQGLQSGAAAPAEEKAESQPERQDMSAWLSKQPAKPSEAPAAAPAELPDWLNQLKEQAAKTEAAQPSPAASEATPEWLAHLQPESEAQPEEPHPPAAPAEEIPDWLSKLETKAGTGATAPAAPAFVGEPVATPSEPTGQTPDWLAKLQADVTAASDAEARQEEFEVASEASAPAEALPDWLSGVKPGTPPSGGTPALVINTEEKIPGKETEAAFSMETPDWLSTLKPEQRKEEPPAAPAEAEEEQPTASLEPADLPSWVQAMRPVEAVVAEAKASAVDERQVTEERGPLAGLRGVLPASPGLGSLRKPPAYTTKLQASDSQQRFADSLEKLISAETIPHATRSARPISGRLLRWIITILLLLAVGLPIVTGIQVAPSSALYPPEMIAAYTVIGKLPASSPVLIVFDYEPALSGELEAAAAPVIDHLLYSGARVTLISTSPTGPVLAERFLLTTQSHHNYQSEQQYVNLGYLAGGPAGILYFASSPAEAAPVSVDGTPAWQLPPLQGVQKLSDFNAVLVLTDSADTGRTWIEQAGSSLGETPMLMVISAQAEPMIRPYYDSGQIKGLVTGLAGGKAYEQAIQHPGRGQAYWNAFSTGLLAAELLILVGGIWSAISAWRERRSKTGEEA